MRKACVLALVCTVGLGHRFSLPVAASCAVVPSLPAALDKARIAFVGTVLRTENRSTTAVVRVEQVWRGEHVPRLVIDRAGISAESRHFQQGRRYLFIPEAVTRTSPYIDDSCTATRLWTPALTKYRPRSAHRP